MIRKIVAQKIIGRKIILNLFLSIMAQNRKIMARKKIRPYQLYCKRKYACPYQLYCKLLRTKTVYNRVGKDAH